MFDHVTIREQQSVQVVSDLPAVSKQLQFSAVVNDKSHDDRRHIGLSILYQAQGIGISLSDVRKQGPFQVHDIPFSSLSRRVWPSYVEASAAALKKQTPTSVDNYLGCSFVLADLNLTETDRKTYGRAINNVGIELGQRLWIEHGIKIGEGAYDPLSYKPLARIAQLCLHFDPAFEGVRKASEVKVRARAIVEAAESRIPLI